MSDERVAIRVLSFICSQITGALIGFLSLIEAGH
jgi:hypothetical protein